MWQSLVHCHLWVLSSRFPHFRHWEAVFLNKLQPVSGTLWCFVSRQMMPGLESPGSYLALVLSLFCFSSIPPWPNSRYERAQPMPHQFSRRRLSSFFKILLTTEFEADFAFPHPVTTLTAFKAAVGFILSSDTSFQNVLRDWALSVFVDVSCVGGPVSATSKTKTSSGSSNKIHKICVTIICHDLLLPSLFHPKNFWKSNERVKKWTRWFTDLLNLYSMSSWIATISSFFSSISFPYGLEELMLSSMLHQLPVPNRPGFF